MAVKVLTQTVTRRNMERSGFQSGRYIWRGPASDPVFCIQDARDFLSHRIDVVCETPCEAVVLCERTTNAPGTIPSTNHGFTRWRIFGNGLAQRGFWYRATVDANNEHGKFHANTVYGCDHAFVFEGQQSKHHRITHNVVEACDVAVMSDSGFKYEGGTIGVCIHAFELTRVGEPVRIADVGVETTQRLLVTSGLTTAAQTIKLDQVRYEADQLASDGEMIVMRHAGPLVMLGGRYGGGNQPIPRIALRGTGHQYVEFVGRPLFGSFGAHERPVVVAQNPAEAVVTGEYVAQAFRDSAENTVSVDRVTVERITQ